MRRPLWALGVPFGRLVEPPAPTVRVIRVGEGTRLHSEQANFVGTLLAARSPHARRDLYILEMEPGASRHAAPHNPGSIEHAVVAAGRARLGPQDRPVELAAGDYATYPGDVAHVHEALEEGTWVVMVMEHP